MPHTVRMSRSAHRRVGTAALASVASLHLLVLCVLTALAAPAAGQQEGGGPDPGQPGGGPKSQLVTDNDWEVVLLAGGAVVLSVLVVFVMVHARGGKRPADERDAGPGSEGVQGHRR